jgi:broad specificity phosphatase PhoE
MAVFLVRHAIALGRSEWNGDDALRPLTKRGERQALGLVDILGADDVRRIHASPAVRCVETVRPLGTKLGLEIEPDGTLFEGSGTRKAIELAEAMAERKGDSVLCSHGDVIPEVLRRLIRDGMHAPHDLHCAKGSTWRLDWDGKRFSAAHYLPPTE